MIFASAARRGRGALLALGAAPLILAGCAEVPPPPPVEKPKLEFVAPPPAPPATPGRVVAPPPEKKDVYTTEQIHFAVGSAEINAAALQVLRLAADKLAENPKLLITLVGYTDDLGSREYNVALNQKRVAAVTAALQAKGVKSRRIKRSDGDPERAITGPCKDEVCRQALRRVELRFSEKPDKP